MTVPWRAAADRLLAIDLRLIDDRETLRDTLATNPKTAGGLARTLRSTSADLQLALSTISDLAAAGAPATLVDRLVGLHREVADTVLETLSYSLLDVTRYRTASSAVVARLDGLDDLMRELAATAGLPAPLPPPAARPSGGGGPPGSAAPSVKP